MKKIKLQVLGTLSISCMVSAIVITLRLLPELRTRLIMDFIFLLLLVVLSINYGVIQKRINDKFGLRDRSMTAVILLNIFTATIYGAYWTWKTHNIMLDLMDAKIIEVRKKDGVEKIMRVGRINGASHIVMNCVPIVSYLYVCYVQIKLGKVFNELCDKVNGQNI